MVQSLDLGRNLGNPVTTREQIAAAIAKQYAFLRHPLLDITRSFEADPEVLTPAMAKGWIQTSAPAPLPPDLSAAEPESHE